MVYKICSVVHYTTLPLGRWHLKPEKITAFYCKTSAKIFQKTMHDFSSSIIFFLNLKMSLGPSPLPSPTEEEETKNSSDVMPSIPDVLLRKLRVHKSLPGR